MGVCLVTGGKSQYSGLCVFGAQDVKATISAYAGLRVKAHRFCKPYIILTIIIIKYDTTVLNNYVHLYVV